MEADVMQEQMDNVAERWIFSQLLLIIKIFKLIIFI